MLEKYGVELIGASIEAIERGENRESFKKIVEELGGEVARCVVCHSMDDCFAAADELGYPMVVRPSFTMGGTGSGIAYDADDLRRIAGAGPRGQPDHRGAPGGVDHRLEGVRARGDAGQGRQRRDRLLDREPRPDGRAHRRLITVAPAMTLTDREYQHLRDLAIGIIRSVGVDTGGCNIQSP